jgi:DnaJ family protein C protein 25
MKSYLLLRSLACVLFALLLSATTSFATNEHNTEGESTTTSSSENNRQQTAKTPTESDFDPSNEDWGSYYDPQNIFCGKFDCYKILGFDYESFGKVKPDTKEITKRYRQLSREWHPDKSKHKNAKERFVKIARAYEVLTDREQRKEYDDLRYNQEAYFMKYGSSVLWSYAPQTDTSIVVIVLFLLGNIASWYMQKHRWQMVANRLIKAALEDWTPSQGGTAESKQLREEALTILAKREDSSGESAETTPAKSGKQKAAGKAKQKLSLKDKKKEEQDALEPIIAALVNDIKDFGGGFHQPTWKDLMAVGLVKLPMKITAGIVWETKYWLRRARNIELSDEEKEVLTERAVGSVAWDIASEEDREEMLKRQLWVKENFNDWKEDQEIRNLSAADQKYYNKLKKKGKLE